MTDSYWPWWLGGIALAVIAVGFPLLTGGPLGVSGFLGRLLGPRSTGGPAADPGACGGGGPAKTVASGCSPIGTGSTNSAERLRSFLFLLGMAIGGGLAGWAGGQRWGATGLSPEFYRIFSPGLPAILALFVGGILVGFGTRLSGGCTSGHGLSGCGRLQPASLAATAVFFGVAIAVSFLLQRVAS